MRRRIENAAVGVAVAVHIVATVVVLHVVKIIVIFRRCTRRRFHSGTVFERGRI